MKLYHGTSYDKAQEIIEGGQYVSGRNDNSWSGAETEGLFCSNVREYAEQYGDALIKIEVEADSVIFIQDCPITEGDYGWQPEFDDAKEYIVPAGVRFSAREA